MTNHYANIHASLLRFCSDFKDLAAQDGFVLHTLNLDAFTNDETWPEGDFIGLGEFNVEIMDTYQATCIFGLSTYEDRNLYRMRKLVKLLAPHVVPGRAIGCFDETNGALIGNLMILQGTRIGSPLETKTQPILPVFVRLETDLRSYS